MEIINAGEGYAAARITIAARNERGDDRSWSGTGFLLLRPNDNERAYLVTNRHVFNPHIVRPLAERPPAPVIDHVTLDYWSLEADWRNAGPRIRSATYAWPDAAYAGDSPDNVDEDVAACRIERAHWPDGEPLLLESASLLRPREQQRLDVGQQLVIAGYPGFMNGAERPIFRTGFVASDPLQTFKHFGGRTFVAGRALAYEGMSFGGLSGSPVWVAPNPPEEQIGRPGRILGINAGHVKTEDGSHSGISYLFTASVIVDAVEKARAGAHELRKI